MSSDPPSSPFDPSFRSFLGRTRESSDRKDGARQLPGVAGLSADALLAAKGLPVRVAGIRVFGADRTHPAIFAACLSPLHAVTAAEDGSPLDVVLSAMLSSGSALRAKQLFSAVDIQLTPDRYVDITVREARLLSLRTEANASATEKNVEVSGSVRNFFGRGESLAIDATVGHKYSTQLKAVAKLDADAPPHLPLTLQAGRAMRHRPESSHWQQDLFASATLDPWTLEVSRRQVQGLDPRASLSVRQWAGPHSRISLRRTFSVDRRDDTVLPTEGHALVNSAEVAFLPGPHNLLLLKNEAVGQHWWRMIFPEIGAAIGVTWNLGAVVPLRGLAGRSSPTIGDERVPLPDRFFGYDRWRGIDFAGIGPRDGHDAVGGTLQASTTLSLVFPLPGYVLQRARVRGHAWVQGAHLTSLSALMQPQGGDAASLGRRIFLAPANLVLHARCIAGVGIQIPTPVGNIELNYCIPVQRTIRAGDRLREWHLGVGFNLL